MKRLVGHVSMTKFLTPTSHCFHVDEETVRWGTLLRPTRSGESEQKSIQAEDSRFDQLHKVINHVRSLSDTAQTS